MIAFSSEDIFFKSSEAFWETSMNELTSVLRAAPMLGETFGEDKREATASEVANAGEVAISAKVKGD